MFSCIFWFEDFENKYGAQKYQEQNCHELFPSCYQNHLKIINKSNLWLCYIKKFQLVYLMSWCEMSLCSKNCKSHKKWTTDLALKTSKTSSSVFFCTKRLMPVNHLGKVYFFLWTTLPGHGRNMVRVKKWILFFWPKFSDFNPKVRFLL